MVSQAMSVPAIPTATYRLQFNRNFTFRDAAELVPYLASLGISHCYASPYLRARPGSTHGYDIIDHNSLNPEIGSQEDYDHFVAELHRHGMGQILDIVPNHMGIMGSDNSWWLDVLENGQASHFADFFDIDWDPIKDELRGKILVPVLADQYGNILEKGELHLSFDPERGEFSIFYFQHCFPIDPREYPRILLRGLQQVEEDRQEIDPDLLELQSIATALSHLPPRTELDSEQRRERIREKEVQKNRLSALVSRSQIVRQQLEKNVSELNGVPGDSKSFDALHELIKAQAYRLAQWRVAADDINYRRFFDIHDLAALRMEREQVFEPTHGFILDLIAKGKVNGLRIDHPDGLYDPAQYFRRLQESIPASQPLEPSSSSRATYVIIEKILMNREHLRGEWPVEGTTGYEYANLVSGLVVDQSSALKMERNYRAFTGISIDFAEVVYRSKKLIVEMLLASELNVLANTLSRIALANRHTCDFTLNSLRRALAEIIANFPVYRTYVSGQEISEEDRRYVEAAVAASKAKSRTGDLTIFDFIRRMMLVETQEDEPAARRRAILRFAMKLQQVTSAVMAKGLEDTALYRYHRLVSLNDVGGNPARFGVSVEEFHRANQERAENWPNSMLATSTHDAKRSEDVRTRIAVLSEIPALFRLNVGRWAQFNRSKKRMIEGRLVPSRNDEYLFYQTLVGAWPVGAPGDDEWKNFSERIEQYMLKAIREAKEFTSWVNPNPDYENATIDFVRAVLYRGARNRFPGHFSEFHRLVSRLGMMNSLSQTLLKLTSPGVPDIYQGNELWDFSLVDPDNRRRVNYDIRRTMLATIRQKHSEGAQFCRELIETTEDGRIKLYLTWKTLCFRASHRELFCEGMYTPLELRGVHADRVCAFARIRGSQAAVAVAPRLWAALLAETNYRHDSEIWKDTRVELPATSSAWRNILSGESVIIGSSREAYLSTLLQSFPVALLATDLSELRQPKTLCAEG
jgi:(1->4)-alpha-D-glucan 1-alpha-D-glucosylmutase